MMRTTSRLVGCVCALRVRVLGLLSVRTWFVSHPGGGAAVGGGTLASVGGVARAFRRSSSAIFWKTSMGAAG